MLHHIFPPVRAGFLDLLSLLLLLSSPPILQFLQDEPDEWDEDYDARAPFRFENRNTFTQDCNDGQRVYRFAINCS